MSEEKAEELEKKGVKDSKLLTPSQREKLYEIIIQNSTKYSVQLIPPSEVDIYVKRKKKHTKLNYLEAIYMSKALDEVDGEVAYVDASDTDVRLFAAQVEQNLKRRVSLVVLHHADRLFPVVSAASIIAKVSRDREVQRIKEEIGDFGSGYPSDPRTISFLREWMGGEKEPPPYCRISWKTWKRITDKQLRLGSV